MNQKLRLFQCTRSKALIIHWKRVEYGLHTDKIMSSSDGNILLSRVLLFKSDLALLCGEGVMPNPKSISILQSPPKVFVYFTTYLLPPPSV